MWGKTRARGGVSKIACSSRFRSPRKTNSNSTASTKSTQKRAPALCSPSKQQTTTYDISPDSRVEGGRGGYRCTARPRQPEYNPRHPAFHWCLPSTSMAWRLRAGDGGSGTVRLELLRLDIHSTFLRPLRMVNNLYTLAGEGRSRLTAIIGNARMELIKEQ